MLRTNGEIGQAEEVGGEPGDVVLPEDRLDLGKILLPQEAPPFQGGRLQQDVGTVTPQLKGHLVGDLTGDPQERGGHGSPHGDGEKDQEDRPGTLEEGIFEDAQEHGEFTRDVVGERQAASNRRCGLCFSVRGGHLTSIYRILQHPSRIKPSFKYWTSSASPARYAFCLLPVRYTCVVTFRLSPSSPPSRPSPLREGVAPPPLNRPTSLLPHFFVAGLYSCFFVLFHHRDSPAAPW